MAPKKRKDDFIVDDDDDEDQAYSSNAVDEDDDEDEASLSDDDNARPSSKKSKGKAKDKGSKPASKGKGKDKSTEKKSSSANKRVKRAPSDSDEDQGEAESKAKAAKSRTDVSKPAARLETNHDGEQYGDLGSRKRISVSTFKDAVYVNIREYYEDRNTEEWKPGKKGIALNVASWEKLKELIVAVDLQIERTESKQPKKKLPKSPKYINDSE